VENKSADLTPPPEERKPEEIEREMLETRQSLTQKVAALEQAVVGNIHNVTQTVADVKEQVKDTVESVKESVAGTVDTVKEKLKDALDISSHVRAQPWAAVGISAAAGFLTGFLTASGTRSIPRRMSEASAPAGMYAVPHTTSARDESDGGGWLHGLMGGMFGGVLGDLGQRAARELRTIGEQALNTALQSLRQKVETTVPHLVDSAVAGVVPGAADGTGAGSGRPGYPPRM